MFLFWELLQSLASWNTFLFVLSLREIPSHHFHLSLPLDTGLDVLQNRRYFYFFIISVPNTLPSLSTIPLHDFSSFLAQKLLKLLSDWKYHQLHWSTSKQLRLCNMHSETETRLFSDQPVHIESRSMPSENRALDGVFLSDLSKSCFVGPKVSWSAERIS